jgi:4'-phosphopantetheinyl transferase
LRETTEWRETSQFPALGQFEIHVWRINLCRDDAEAARLEGCLNPSERKRAARFHFPHDRRRFVIRRAVLRHLLGGYAGCRPEAVGLSHTTHGKPFLEHQEKPDGLGFSCSHSADLALIALARGREIGVDLEFHRSLPEAGEMAKTFFSVLEIAELAKAPEALKQKTFFDGWTRKEAFVKAIGLGLAFPLNRFSVSLSPDQPATLLEVENDPQATERWSMRSIDAGPRSSSALAFEGRDTTVKYFEWSSRQLI